MILDDNLAWNYPWACVIRPKGGGGKGDGAEVKWEDCEIVKRGDGEEEGDDDGANACRKKKQGMNSKKSKRRMRG